MKKYLFFLFINLNFLSASQYTAVLVGGLETVKKDPSFTMLMQITVSHSPDGRQGRNPSFLHSFPAFSLLCSEVRGFLF